ncbi:MAG TPA: hypothetical protein VHW96_02435 [Solirubrobacteraceae bacterium]|nr:hypothetical protein [Solirubrobacteraceae bacterium]
MTIDALAFLRAEDPVPHGSSAPAMEWVLGQIARTPAPPRRRRFAIALVPTVAVAATLAVVAAVVVLAVTHRGPTAAHVAPAGRTTPTVRSAPSPGSLMPRGGMPGLLSIAGVASSSSDRAQIDFSQCQPCYKGGDGRGSATFDWRAETSDGGVTWQVARTSANLDAFAFAGADGWGEGLRSAGHGGGGMLTFFASHDGGRTWHVASSEGRASGTGGVSISGGEVWMLGSCAGVCSAPNAPNDLVLRAPASGDHLAPTAGQPPLGDTTNVSVVATGRDEAYVLTDDYGTVDNVATITHTRLFATRDGGRTWQRIPTPCPHLTFGRLYAGGTQSLWAVCSPTRGPGELRRSTDGGTHWTTLPSRPGNIQVQPASAQVAWATTRAGQVLRTANGGRSWTSVWYGGRPEATAPSNAPPVNRAWDEALAVQSPSVATVVAVVTRGHVDGHASRTDFVVYHTTDGGRTWTPRAVLLPPG